MTARYSGYIIAAGLVFLLAGCADSPPTAELTGTRSTSNVVTPSNGESKIARLPVSAAVMSLPDVKNTIAAHKGKVVVVDLWAMW